jgi:adenylate cyclase
MGVRIVIRRSAVKPAVLSVLFAWLLCAVLSVSQAWQPVELQVFDAFSVATAPRRSQLPITIVGIDEASSDRLGKTWPWPRDIHAQLISRLHKAGASVIAFDLSFTNPGTPAEDQALARAIAASGNVVMGADRVFYETALVRQWRRLDPAPDFVAAGAVAGVRHTLLDDDAVLRRVPEDEDAFWRQVIRTLVRTRPGAVPEPVLDPGGMLRHLGPARTFPWVPYHRVLEGDPGIPPDFFRDQVVLIGRDSQTGLVGPAGAAESFATPFLRTSRSLTPGVEIQATLIENALMGQTLQAATLAQNLGMLTLALAAGGTVLLFWHPWRSPLLVMALGGAVVAASAWLFHRHGLWLFTAAPVFGLAASLAAMGGFAWWTQRRHDHALRTSFGRYVAQAVVDEIVAHPEQLRLGGERRELTVLFCDLTGFSALCERLPPEGVADVINLYATEMARTVMDHGGTVDKFIGDAVMAFWGAPLPDADHAGNAVRAAVAMQQAIAHLQPRFSAMGAGRLELRIGINSGPAVVGNLGSARRFTYTALGDAVNLASRLEEANKIYRTRILLSGSTAALLSPDLRLRHIDRVRVRGKQAAVDLFTPCADERLCALAQQAWEAWVEQDWGACLALLAEIAAIDPYDGVPPLFEARIARLRAAAPPAHWDATSDLA